MMLRNARRRTSNALRRLLACSVSSLALAGFATGQEPTAWSSDAAPSSTSRVELSDSFELAADSGAGVQLVSCYACGNPASACSCNANGPMGAGPAGDLAGECRFTNLYWCSPFGETYKDPCDFNTCSDCNFSEAPLWYASVEAVALARDQKDDLAFATLGAGGPVVLDTGDIKTEFDAGMRLLMGVTLTDVFRLEGSYLGSFEWSGRAAVRNGDDNGQGGFGNLFAPFSNFGTPVGFLGTDFNDFASIDLASSFHSGEINLRRRLIIPRNAWPKEQVPCYAASFLMGLRYLKLDEHFGYLSNSTVPAGGSVNLANIDTSNEMFGAQIGLLSQFLLKGQGWIDFDVKGGIYQNQA
ncbi:MAG: BBP7 family outer membrane beta-barrel protein, partial [Planctomycetales bacterium]|nr:BBP7 family outer membrane beta-barrel protein [Planctomycetales bacterium]